MTTRALASASVPALALALLSACSSTTSEDSMYRVRPSTGIATSDLHGLFSVTGEGGSAKVLVHAEFQHAKTSEGVGLEGADAVFCEGVQLGGGGSGFLAIELPRKAAGEVYRFELRRGVESVFVTVAAIDEVNVLAPAGAAELRRTSPMTITWEPMVGTEITAQLDASCDMASAKATTEAGSITLPAFVAVDGPGGLRSAANAPCDGTVYLTRTQKSAPTTALARTQGVAEERSQSVAVRVVE
jgi:hypothetical protein